MNFDEELRRKMLECFDRFEKLAQPTLAERFCGFVLDHGWLILVCLYAAAIAAMILFR